MQLSSSGSCIQWTVAQSNQAGVTMHCAPRCRCNGYGQNGTVACYVNGTLVQTVNLTSYYAWQ